MVLVFLLNIARGSLHRQANHCLFNSSCSMIHIGKYWNSLEPSIVGADLSRPSPIYRLVGPITTYRGETLKTYYSPRQSPEKLETR